MVKQLRPTAALLFVLTTACHTRAPDTLFVRERIALPDSAATILQIDDRDGFWLAGPGRILRLAPTGALEEQVELGSSAPIEWLHPGADRTYFHTPLAIGKLGPEAADTAAEGSVTLIEMPASPSSAVALDPLGRFILRAGESGAIFAHDPETLEPIWGWAAVGATGTAIAFSPGGERLYQAIAAEDLPPELLVRDVQTGRILRRHELYDPVHLLISAGGNVYAIGWEDRAAGNIVAFHWVEGELQSSWRSSLDELGLTAPLRAALSPSGRLLAVLAVDDEAGLHVLDVEAGRSVDRLRGAALDVGFDSADQIYGLYAGELRRLQ